MPHRRVAAEAEPRGRPTRLRADRVTNEVSVRDVQKVVNAARFALAAGVPLNRFTTIHWGAAEVGDGLAATARFLKLAREWTTLQGGKFAYIFMREGGSKEGQHVHLLLHVSPHLLMRFAIMQRRWLRRIGARNKDGVIKSRPIGRDSRTALRAYDGASDYGLNLVAVVRYILKGASPELCARHGWDHKLGGEIVGKRCGISENIGAAAQRRAPLSGGQTLPINTSHDITAELDPQK